MSDTECHDYDATSGTLSFQPGDWVRTISVRIIDDNLPELNETLFVALSNPTGPTIADGQGLATIFGSPTDPSDGPYQRHLNARHRAGRGKRGRSACL